MARIKGTGERPPTFAAFLGLVAGRTPIICELKSRFDGDWRIADRIAALAATYDGPLAFKSFDPSLIAYLRLRWLSLGPHGRPCPVGMVAEASYDGPQWRFLTDEQRRECANFDHRGRSEPDFLSWNVDDLPHKTPFFEKELYGLPVMTWTVRKRRAARGGAEMGRPDRVRGWRPAVKVGARPLAVSSLAHRATSTSRRSFGSTMSTKARRTVRSC